MGAFVPGRSGPDVKIRVGAEIGRPTDDDLAGRCGGMGVMVPGAQCCGGMGVVVPEILGVAGAGVLIDVHVE